MNTEFIDQGLKSEGKTCWICKSSDLSKVRSNKDTSSIKSSDFKITDDNYGTTYDIFECRNCGFLQCSDIPTVTSFYEEMVDESYVKTSFARSIQARKIIKYIKKIKKNGKFLDVGAGSGILVEQANYSGYIAEGIEPSKYLCKVAKEKLLEIHNGTLPNESIKKKYDVITLIDVIEHVTDPVDLVKNISQLLADEGVAIIVTPDVSSLASKIMGWKWWHFRKAHVGYFNLKTLDICLNAAGLIRVRKSRPSWYLPFNYLIERLSRYIPKLLYLNKILPNYVLNLSLPINLYDSYLIVVKKMYKNK